jgi:hypothetical protein
MLAAFNRYYRGSSIFTAVCLTIAAAVGFAAGGIGGAIQTLVIAAVLGVLEVSLSFDNAIVNATVLKDMDEVWRRRFLTWGILIAVFGMRLVFPLIIVAVAAGIGPLSALSMALFSPDEYAAILGAKTVHAGIMGFGGAFLLMVGLKYFFDADKEIHWIHAVESKLQRFSAIESAEIAIVLLAIGGVGVALLERSVAEAAAFAVSGAFGLATYVIVEGFGNYMEAKNAASGVAKAGLGAFLYLEVLDASFSFDGVIGAFALTTNLIVIALGLGIGAIFVRSMTVMLVDSGHMSEYRYLEHGAFWAILALGGTMFAQTLAHVPEVVTGLTGAILIGLALRSSVKANRLERDEGKTGGDA